MNTKSPASTLCVSFNGQVIRGRNGKEIFANAISTIGIDRVAALGLASAGIPLAAKSNSVTYHAPPVFIGGFYVCTHSSNKEKKRILAEIADRLGLAISARISGASN
jgi:hypothetical protein